MLAGREPCPPSMPFSTISHSALSREQSSPGHASAFAVLNNHTAGQAHRSLLNRTRAST